MVAAKKVEKAEIPFTNTEVNKNVNVGVPGWDKMPKWDKTVWEPLEQPMCPRCGSKTIKKGTQIYATAPHKRQKYQCVVCGKTVCPHPPAAAEVKKV